MPAQKLITADELLHIQPSDKQIELVRGVMVVREPPGCRHGDIAINLSYHLAHFVRERGLGRVWSETGYVLSTDPDTVRGPDISFVRAERVPHPIPRGFARFAPDLAVEVLSPDDRPGEVLEKVAEYLKAGTQLVWVIDPDHRQARVHRADGTVAVVGDRESLDGEEILPGFTCPIAGIL